MIVWLQLVGVCLITAGVALTFFTALGMLRLGSLFSRMHASTKPQVLGLIAVTLGIALSLRTWWAAGLCVLIIVLQLMTAPVSANLVARSASRSGLVDEQDLIVNHLAEDLKEAGYTRPGD